MCTLIYFLRYILFCVYWHWVSSAILLPRHLQDTSAALCSLLDFSLPALSNPVKERVCHSKNWFDWKSFHLKSQAGKIFILKHSFLLIAAYHGPPVHSSYVSFGFVGWWNGKHNITCLFLWRPKLSSLPGFNVFPATAVGFGLLLCHCTRAWSLNIAPASKATPLVRHLMDIHISTAAPTATGGWSRETPVLPVLRFHIPGAAAHLR